MKRFFTLATLCLALGGALVGSAHAAPEITASDRAAQALECPTPLVPFAISSACAQATSIQETRDALRFANASGPIDAAVIGAAPTGESPTDGTSSAKTQAEAQLIGGLDCPAPVVPYGISPACAHAIGIQEARDALQFANAAATEGQTAADTH